jgi:lipoate---protein ligase
MFLINLESTDPFFNLAVDEYLLKDQQDDFMVLGINDTSVIVGKHQSPHRETNTRFITDHGIPVIRRISGGGTVFHDNGNLNFSFILNSEEGKQVDFRKYSRPVLDFLSSIGLNAGLEGKSDLRIDGCKISGNAEHVYHNRVLHHGTLLFDADLDLLKDVISRDTGKYLTRAVTSNPSPVMNLKYVLKYVLKDVLKDILKDVLKDIDNIKSFRDLMLQWFIDNYQGSEILDFSDFEIDKIKALADSKYRTWEWNFAYGPEYRFENRFVYNGIESVCRLFVKDGIIHECDLKGSEGLSAALKQLIGCRHMPEDVRKVLSNENIPAGEFDIFDLF